MKPPYFIVAAVCENKACKTTAFSKLRKSLERIGASGQPYRLSKLVCDECGQWADVIGYVEEVKS